MRLSLNGDPVTVDTTGFAVVTDGEYLLVIPTATLSPGTYKYLVRVSNGPDEVTLAEGWFVLRRRRPTLSTTSSVPRRGEASHFRQEDTVDLLAFLLGMFAAIVLFLLDFADRCRTVSRWPSFVPLGLAFLAGALICQFVHATSSKVGG